MEKDYSNYDLFDRMIDNERKAKSWTVFWISLLCILSGVVIGMVFSISQKNKDIEEKKIQIETQFAILEKQKDTISDKNALIKALEEDCKRDITKATDSLKEEVDKTLTTITKLEYPAADTSRNSTTTTQQKAKNDAIKISISKLTEKFKSIQKDFQKEKIKVFIQYNYSGDLKQVNDLIAKLKNNDDYLVTPAELVNRKFSYLMKCYNYEDAKQESWLQNVTGRYLGIDPGDIRISHDKKDGMSPTVEIWIGSPNFVAPVRDIKLQMQQRAN